MSATDVLLAMSTPDTRYCVHCGRPFATYVASRRLVCSTRCSTARWRAIGKLAGTHGTVNGQWVRLP